MRGWIVYSFVATIIAVAGLAFTVGFVVSGALDDDSPEAVRTTEAPTQAPTRRPTSKPAPTQYVPRLTGTEAAAKARGFLFGAAETDEQQSNVLALRCSAQDFNENDRAWIVVCVNPSNNKSFTFRVYDSSGKVEVVG